MTDPQSLHKYLYVHGDPVMGVDPSGLWSIPAFTIGNALRAGLIGMGVGSVAGFAYGVAEARILGASWSQAFYHGLFTGLWGGILGFLGGVVWFGAIAGAGALQLASILTIVAEKVGTSLYSAQGIGDALDSGNESLANLRAGALIFGQVFTTLGFTAVRANTNPVPFARSPQYASRVAAVFNRLFDRMGRGRRNRPGKLAILYDYTGGETIGFSKKRYPLFRLHKIVQQLGDEVPEGQRAPFHLKCAECHAISVRLFLEEAKTGQPIASVAQARQVLAGAKIQVRNLGARGSENPCPSCTHIVNTLGITPVP